MHAKQFLRLLRDPRKMTSDDLQALQGLVQEHPYFQLAYTLLAKAAHDREDLHVGQAVQTASVYATDRSHLKALLEGTLPIETPVSGSMSPALALGEQENLQKGTHDFVNDYVNTIQKKAQKKVTKTESLAQLNSIQTFLQNDVRFKTPPLYIAPNADLQVDLTQKSTTFCDDLATETLAQILWQQGKLQLTLTIYEKLILRFPEKKTYFTALIEKLKGEM